MTFKIKNPELVLKNGDPVAVILNIKDYQELLERVEDADDLKILAEMRKKLIKRRKLDEFLAEYQPSV